MPWLMPGLPPDVARDGVLHNWTSYRGTLENVIVHHRAEPAATRLAKLGVPVRLIHGERDDQAPIETTRDLAIRVGWRLTLVPGRTHSLPLEAPDVCADVLLELLASKAVVDRAAARQHCPHL